MQTPPPFSYAYYAHLLGKALEQGYVLSSFENYEAQNPKTVILRHDVDYTVNGVLEFAKIEAQLGCTATYFFRVHADNYNLFSCVVWPVLQSLEAMGHEVGLHFEAMAVGRAMGMSPQALLKQEKQVLEAILGHPVKAASEHRELSSVIHQTVPYREVYDPYAAGFSVYAMDPRFTQEMKYLSDSNAQWREGDLLEHLGQHARFQVLIHPDWWYETDFLLKGPYHHPLGTADQ